MAWYDYVPSVPWQLGNMAFGNGDVAAWANGKPNAPKMDQSPFMGDWRQLIGQLQNQANPNYTGPSLAENTYKQAAGDAMRRAQSMSTSGSAGGARQAQIQMGRVNQGLSEGVSNARLQEQLAAQQQLQGALGGANNAWFGPASQNFQAQLNTPSNMQKLMGLFQQIGPMVAAMGA